MVLRRLPEAAAEAEKPKASEIAALKLVDKGVPAIAISKIKTFFMYWGKKLWHFVLEAKDLRPQAIAGYRMRKLFGQRQSLPKALTEGGQKIKGEDYFLGLIKSDPKNLTNYDALGKFYLEESNTEDAIDIYKYLTEHDRANADFQARLAYCYYQIKDFENTALHYEQSLALDSSQPNRYYNLGLVREALGKNQEALEAIGRAIVLEPNNSRYYLSYSNVCLKLGLNDQAMNALEKARAVDPENEKVTQKLDQIKTSK